MISKKEVEHIAELAHLRLTGEDKLVFTKQLGDILNYIEKLDELDTEDIVPTAYTIPMKNILREDKPEPSIEREKALLNAPEQVNGLFRVPKIISE